MIGTEAAAKSTPDGYTLLVSSPGPLTILPHLQKQIAYEPLKDFVPIGLIASNPFLLITHPSVPARTLNDLIITTPALAALVNGAMAHAMDYDDTHPSGAPADCTATGSSEAEIGYACRTPNPESERTSPWQSRTRKSLQEK